MKKNIASNFLLVISLMLLTDASVAIAAEDNWICRAENLITAKYDGSGWAFVHLQGYRTGGSYRVKQNEQGTEATGKTADGTLFTCVKTK